jgi:VIT1/CCC1 family predicted Fe2+/Mn2+ transporter
MFSAANYRCLLIQLNASMSTPRIRKHLRQRRQALRIPLGAQKFLSVLEGIEGGFAISAGVVAGLSFADITSRRVMLITAGISVLVNGVNAAALKYSSEHYEDELDGREKKHAFRHYIVPSLLEFFIYLIVSGLILIPLLVLPYHIEAVIWCVTATLFVLYMAGLWKGYLLHKHPVKDGLELALLGLFIIAAGGLSGFILSR